MLSHGRGGGHGGGSLWRVAPRRLVRVWRRLLHGCDADRAVLVTRMVGGNSPGRLRGGLWPAVRRNGGMDLGPGSATRVWVLLAMCGGTPSGCLLRCDRRGFLQSERILFQWLRFAQDDVRLCSVLQIAAT